MYNDFDRDLDSSADYLSEAYGATARDADLWFMTADEEDFIGPVQARYDMHVLRCVEALVLFVVNATDDICF